METNEALQVRRGVSRSHDAGTAARELFEAIGGGDPSLVLFYASPDYDLVALGGEIGRRFGGRTVIGCTTAGEITPAGYFQGSLTGVAIDAPDFEVVTRRIDGLSAFEFATGEATAVGLKEALRLRAPGASGRDTFAFLLIDGMSMREEGVVSAVHRGLGDVALFGGSAGDGVRFGSTWIYHDGEFRRDVAVLTLVHTPRPFVVFKTEHFVPGSQRMVITAADPATRVVTEINGLPAGREYARMVGLQVDELTPLIFATYPVVVRLGGASYVRSIQKVNDDESLTFFCAIDEGIVLTVAKGIDLVANLRGVFRDVRSKIGEPQLVLGCDCILRNLEIEQRGLRDAVEQIFVENHVIGFATYGEQYNAMHVNQTFTGVAIGR